MFGNRGRSGRDERLGQGFEDERNFGRQQNSRFDDYNNQGGQGHIAMGSRDSELESRSALYLAKVMGWMCVGLLTTVVAALATLTVEPLFMLVFGGSPFVIFIVQIGLVLVLSRGIGRLSPGAATVLFMLYSGVTGLTMSVFVLIYDLGSLLLAFSVTTFVFLTMSVYGFVTRKDLTSIGRLCLFGLIGIILAMVVNIFLANTMMDFVITVIGVLVFIGLIAYDTQHIKGLHQHALASGYDEYSPELRKLAIIGALKLYLDFINLFIMMLRLLGRRR